MMPNNTTEIFLEQDEELSVIKDGIKVVFDRSGGIHVFGSPTINRHPKIQVLPSKAEQEILQTYLDLNKDDHIKKRIGEVQENGLLFAGISPETQKPFYTRPFDEPLHMHWNKAQQHTKENAPLRIPKPSELFVLFNHRGKIGHFNESSLYPDSWYWSADECPDKSHIKILRFGDGYQGQLTKDDYASLRLICD